MTTPAQVDCGAALPAEKMAQLRELVRDLLKVPPNGRAQEVAIRDEQGTLLAYLVPGGAQCLVEVDLTDGEPPSEADRQLIPVEDLLAGH